MIVATPDRSASLPALRQLFLLLGLCPLLPAADSLQAALGLGLATALVLAGSGLLLAPCRKHLSAPVQMLFTVLAMAALAASAERLLQAYAPPWHQAAQAALPLVMSAALLLSLCDERGASMPAFIAQRVWLGFGSALLLAATGLLRATLGDAGFLFALEAPGAFLLAGGALALLQCWNRHRSATPGITIEPGSRRVRVTGKI